MRVLLLALVGGLVTVYGLMGLLAQTLGEFAIASLVLALGVWMLWLATRLARKDREDSET